MIKNLCAFMYTLNNEGTIIKCLDSLKNIATCICITDMNSSDKTVQLIEEWKSSVKDIYVSIKQSEFLDEATSNNKAFENAMNKFPNVEYYLHTRPYRYLVNKGFDLDKLDKETYVLKVTNGKYKYIESCLFKVSKRWSCKGVVNAFWVCMDKTTECILSDLEIIEDHFDTQDDMNRKIKLIEENINIAENEIVLSRYKYFLGYLYYKTKQYNKAVEILKDRINTRGLPHDLYHCYILLAMSLYRLNSDNSSVSDYLLNAYHNSPYKVESLYKLAKILRKRGLYNAALLLLDKIRSIKFTYDILPSNTYINDFLIDLEYSACCAQDLFKRKDGYNAFIVLLDKKHLMSKKQLELLNAIESIYFAN